jgi:hypothetical protein
LLLIVTYVSQGAVEMWGRRRNRGTKLSRQLALGMLEDAMGRVQEPRDQTPQNAPVPAPRRGGLIPAALARLGRRRSA